MPCGEDGRACSGSARGRPGCVAGIAWAAVVAAWLLPVWLLAQRDPGVHDYFHELVFVQTFGRYVDPWHHYRPAWYYLQVMATLWLPAVLLLPWMVPRWAAALRERDARVLLPLGFAAVYLLFFTVSRGKRDLYILSALPMLVLPMGYLLPRAVAAARRAAPAGRLHRAGGAAVRRGLGVPGSCGCGARRASAGGRAASTASRRCW